MAPYATLLLLAAPGRGVKPQALLQSIAATWADRSEPALVVEMAGRIPRSLQKSDGKGMPMTMEASPAAAMLTLRGDLAAAAAAMAAVIDALDAQIDRAASSVVGGQELVVKAGTGDVSVVMAVRRLPHYTRASFHHRWQTIHAEFGRRIAAPGYRQIHAAAAFERTPLGELIALNDHDGVAIVTYGSESEMFEVRASPQVSHDAVEDEMQFIDHSRSSLMLFASI
jgi:hypothetical protein